MRIFAILLFVATLALVIAAVSSPTIQNAKVARARVAIHAVPGHGRPAPERAAAEKVATDAERETKPFFYMQIGLTFIIVPFCIFLLFKRYQDVATKTFAFSSLTALIAFWFYIPKP
jgi:hypothetical protein